ncbi:uncharacterized protein N7515_009175 [Penicillium bovifimosum]|uniref:Uncharacterized protein n=1 Tax=Penicillium bovifimosum TaxID=126998 RepID=A0A9W9GJW7_9EURO|nr:uncharacterized protein N7515_009175 [Penicillium bovifimosum]KAJ5121214.1 hypothetical protein N7515_009175 [Penicillium bovifimosum]
MAIFDTEKRPRGLRVPSLAAMKSSAMAKSRFSFHNKKSTESVPSDEAMFTSQPAFLTTPLPKPAPPPNKGLPSPPKEEIPAPSQTPSDNPYFPSVPSSRNGIPARRPIERQSHPDLNGTHQQPPPVTLSPAPPVPDPAQVPALVNDAHSPQPEDFIPTPDSTEPPLAVPEMAREELAPSPFVPPDVEPVTPAFNKVHLACYQQHRAMPVAQNMWCPMPCMTCHKFDIEIRHRCVFCCLRICESCFQSLQKCKNRSVEELVDRISA